MRLVKELARAISPSGEIKLEQKIEESNVIKVKSLKQLRENISKIEAAAREVNGIGGKILFNGTARVGAWSAERADIGLLSTWFEGKISLNIYPYSECMGKCAEAFDYKIALQEASNPYSDFRYYLQGKKTAPWKTDSFYKNAITLVGQLKIPIFSQVYGILLWVNEPKKEQVHTRGGIYIGT